MKNVGIIVFQNLRYAPFLEFYTNALDKDSNIVYDVIYYNRDKDLRELNDPHHIPITWYGKGTNATNKIEKFYNFILYRIQLLRLLRGKKYDNLIILMTMPSILIFDYLVKNYKDRYIVDIRDYTYEKLGIYKKIESIVVNNSAVNIISSLGFKSFLPKVEYYNIHNFNRTNVADKKFKKKKDLPIRISYIGMITYEKQCIELIKLVERDHRFVFNFYGNENTSNLISSFIKENKCTNSTMMGPFLPSQKEDIYRESDLVFNCYGNDRILVKYAISNKFYDGAYNRVPLLTSPNTTMNDLGSDYSFALDLGKITSLDELFDWYQRLDEEKYNEYAKRVIENALEENAIVEEKIVSLIREE